MARFNSKLKNQPTIIGTQTVNQHKSRAAAPAWGCEARLGARSYEQQDAAIG
jgi:hypothetical protein